MFKVLVVDDTKLMRYALSTMLRQLDIDSIEATNGEEALAKYELERPGLVLLDVIMPGLDGHQVAREIRARYPDEWVPIIFLSALEDAEDLRQGIDAGGDDYLTKPIDPVVLRAKIRAMRRIDEMRQRLLAVTEELAQANQKLQTLSLQDGLTGIANRRFFDLALAREFARAHRNARPLSVILGDVDHFKLYNDTYGHPAGDQCLKSVASALRTACGRPADVVARYGGEEFAVILPETDRAGALIIATALNAAVNKLALMHSASPVASNVTISLGVTTWDGGLPMTAEALVKRADDALYQAKRAGRNRHLHMPATTVRSEPIEAAA